MSKKFQVSAMALMAAVCMALVTPVSGAQDRGPGGGGDRAQRGDRGPGGGGDRGGFGQRGGGDRAQRGDRGPGGGFDMAQIQERMLEGMKDRLGSSDDEWVVIKPMVSKVMEAQFALRAFGGGGGGFGGFRGGSDNPEQQALRSAIDSGGDIEAKLKAYRAAREAKEDALQKAREELRAVLTVKQEATLVITGMLD